MKEHGPLDAYGVAIGVDSMMRQPPCSCLTILILHMDVTKLRLPDDLPVSLFPDECVRMRNSARWENLTCSGQCHGLRLKRRISTCMCQKPMRCPCIADILNTSGHECV